MHQYPENWVAIGHAVVYYARAAHAFSAGIKYPYCIYIYVTVRVSNQGFSQIPKTFRDFVKSLFHSGI